jgi:hypothetical protein
MNHELLAKILMSVPVTLEQSKKLFEITDKLKHGSGFQLEKFKTPTNNVMLPPIKHVAMLNPKNFISLPACTRHSVYSSIVDINIKKIDYYAFQ